MKRHFQIFFFIFLFLCLAGCVQTPPAEPVSEKTIQLRWYVNYSWYKTQWGENAVSHAITQKTGVDICFESPDGSEVETLNALISGDSLPDLITIG